MKGSQRKGEPWARTQRSGVTRRRAALGVRQHSRRSDAPGSACGSPAARPLCWWLGEVSHPEPEPDERPSAKRPGNEEGGKPVPERLGGGERSAGRGGAREAKALGWWMELQGLGDPSARTCEEEKLGAGTSYRGKEKQERRRQGET